MFGAVLGNQIFFFFFFSVLETCKCSFLCVQSTEIDETGQTFEVSPSTNNSVFCKSSLVFAFAFQEANTH